MARSWLRIQAWCRCRPIHLACAVTSIRHSNYFWYQRYETRLELRRLTPLVVMGSSRSTRELNWPGWLLTASALREADIVAVE